MADDRLLPVGAAVRSGGVRRAGALRLVGRARRVLRAGRRDSRRARPPRTRSPRSTDPTRELARDRQRAPANARSTEHTAARRAAELESHCSEQEDDRVGHHSGGGRGSRIQPLAFSKELLPVGSRFEGPSSGRARSANISSSGCSRGGATKLCFMISPGKSDILEYYGGRDWRRPHLLCRAAAARGTVRRDLPGAAVHRSRRAGASSVCPTRSGSRWTALCALLDDDRCRFCCFRSIIRSCSMRWSRSDGRRVAARSR